jgi:hypothetical protein
MPRGMKKAQGQMELFPSVRVCNTCNVTKQIDEFSRLKSTTDKRRGSCKSCERNKMNASPISYDQCVCGGLKRKVAKRCYECYLNSKAVHGIKTCRGCNRNLSIEQFGTRRKRDATVLRARCRECDSEFAKQYRESLPAELRRERKRKSRDVQKKRPQKIKRESAIRSFCRRRGWNGVVTQSVIDKFRSTKFCEICQKELPLAIDHCHERNLFRGLLCSACNCAIGLLKDDPKIIKNAARYVAANQVRMSGE